MMQYNDWQHDPLQLGSAGNGIMSRWDLVTGSDGAAFGGIDSKVCRQGKATPKLLPTLTLTRPLSGGNTSHGQAAACGRRQWTYSRTAACVRMDQALGERDSRWTADAIRLRVPTHDAS